MQVSPPAHRTLLRPALFKNVVRIAGDAGIAPSKFGPRFRKALSSTPDPDRALTQFLRYLETGIAGTRIQDFHRQPPLLKMALELFAQSQFLSDILVRSPELLPWLATGAMEGERRRDDLLREAIQSAAPFERWERQIDALKRFHRREMLRIGAREIFEKSDIPTSTRELSALASTVIEAVLQISLNQLQYQTGIMDAGSFAVVGLGKLGGDELNFSSDIDLLFVFDEDKPIQGARARIHSLADFHARLAEFMVRRLSERTAEGHLYRVDLRLRPDGAAGPLVLSRKQYVDYYESRGEAWERQMLLKARVVAGDLETGRRWLSDLEPFLFPKTNLGSPFEKIAELKRAMEKKEGNGGNIKLGAGGIRDIEFIVQALQLVNAVGRKSLRVVNTLSAISGLGRLSLLTRRESRVLSDSYILLRRVEHRLQLLSGAQTHSLPGDARERRLLARRLGYRSASAFAAAVSRHRSAVRRIFDSFFSAGPDRAMRSRKRPPARTLRDVFQNNAEAEELVEELVEQVNARKRGSFRNRLIRELKRIGAAEVGLSNLHRLATTAGLTRTFADAMDDAGRMRLVALIACRASHLIEVFQREPIIFELIVGTPEEVVSAGPAFYPGKFESIAMGRTMADVATIVQLLLGSISIEDAGRRFTAAAESVLGQLMKEMGERVTHEIAVVALGSLGGSEMNYGSDADIVFVHRNDEASDVESAIRRCIGQIRSRGLLEVDVRLRPEGRSSPLAVRLDYLEAYFDKRASLWERQALVKARVLSGGGFARVVERFVADRCYGRPLPRDWKDDLREMRRKIARERVGKLSDEFNIKTASGGIVDIEFAVQALQLRYGREDHAVRTTNTFDAIRKLESAGVVAAREAAELSSNLAYLRTVELFVRLNRATVHPISGMALERGQILAAAMGEAGHDALRERMSGIFERNKMMFEGILNRCPE